MSLWQHCIIIWAWVRNWWEMWVIYWLEKLLNAKQSIKYLNTCSCCIYPTAFCFNGTNICKRWRTLSDPSSSELSNTLRHWNTRGVISARWSDVFHILIIFSCSALALMLWFRSIFISVYYSPEQIGYVHNTRLCTVHHLKPMSAQLVRYFWILLGLSWWW